MRALVDRVDRVLLGSQAQTSPSARRRMRLVEQFRTAFEIAMEFTDEEARYVTQPQEGVERNQRLATLLPAVNTELIIDAYACIGSDAIAFMNTFPNARVHAVQIQNTEETNQRFRRLITNIRTYITTHPTPHHAFQPHGCSAREYVEQRLPVIMPDPATPIALLYLDPPWYGADGVAYSPSGLVTMIDQDMLTPLASQNRKPAVICFKVPAEFTADTMKPHLETCALFAMQGYTLQRTIPVTRHKQTAYLFHIYTPSAQ